VEGAAAEIVELSDRGLPADEVADHLGSTYGIGHARAAEDVAASLAGIRASGVLQGEAREAPTIAQGLRALALHVTARCPLRCRHCAIGPAEPVEPPLALLVLAVEQARSLGTRAFHLTGGEPLERPEALAALEEPTRGAEVTVLTSAVAGYDALRREVLDRGWRLQISLDGPDAATHDAYRGPGAFGRTAASLDALAREGFGRRVALSVCLSRLNVARVEGIVERALRWGVARVHLVRVSRQGRAAEAWEDLDLSQAEWLEAYERLADIHARYAGKLRLTGFLADYLLGCLAQPASRGCRLGETAMVDLDGRVYACIMLGQPERSLGDLRHTPLAECLSPERIGALQGQCEARLSPGGVCAGCDWRAICRGACPGWSAVLEGTLEGTDGLCDLRRRLFPRLLFRLAEARAGAPAPNGDGSDDCLP
jgi:radical SAM protein with 4Fe4S-binding SPASM domain